MTRALTWSLAGSMTTVLSVGLLIAVTNWIGPSIHMHHSTERVLSVLGHEITIGISVTPVSPVRAEGPVVLVNDQTDFVGSDVKIVRVSCLVSP